jgi:uncharacterized membrane-anchored protein YhcB (DUF1043 family)
MLMPSDKKYSIWPALFIICLAFVVPITIGTAEVRIARNAHAETTAIQQLQAIAKAENAFRDVNHHFSSSLEELKDLPKVADLYQYDFRQVSPQSYLATAAPKQPGKQGKRYFAMDESGVVRYEVLRPATNTSPEVPPIGQK